jgi:hypothetical protein
MAYRPNNKKRSLLAMAAVITNKTSQCRLLIPELNGYVKRLLAVALGDVTDVNKTTVGLSFETVQGCG